MKIHIAGTVHGRPEGVNQGDIIDVDDLTAARYCRHHLAEPVVERREERAVAPEGELRTEAPVKRGPGRPPKAAAD
jgi:hypothetical protein